VLSTRTVAGLLPERTVPISAAALAVAATSAVEPALTANEDGSTMSGPEISTGQFVSNPAISRSASSIVKASGVAAISSFCHEVRGVRRWELSWLRWLASEVVHSSPLHSAQGF
jgi:hypothetical protein